MSSTPQTAKMNPSGEITQTSSSASSSQPATATEENIVSVEERLYLAKYKLDERPHLAIYDQAVCQKCAQINGSPQPCMRLCPADVYKWEDGKRNIVSYDNCVECGACRIICPYTNIEWTYPRWGRGLSLRYG